MVKKEIATIAQHHYAGYASEFWEKEKNWQNSLPTPSPQGEHKKHCAKLDWWVDAVAKTEKESFEKTLNACHIIMYENAHNRYYDELRVVFDKLLWSYYT